MGFHGHLEQHSTASVGKRMFPVVVVGGGGGGVVAADRENR